MTGKGFVARGADFDDFAFVSGFVGASSFVVARRREWLFFGTAIDEGVGCGGHFLVGGAVVFYW
jgi:hypothetical protein